MKYIFTFLIFIGLSSSAFGEWKLINEIDDANIWIDPVRIKKVNGKVYATYLWDYPFPLVELGGANSVIITKQILCDEKKYDTLTALMYHRPMEKGDYFYSQVEKEEIWDSWYEGNAMFEFPCSKF